MKRICSVLMILSLSSTNLFALSHSSSNYTLSMPRIVASGGSASSFNYSIYDAVIGKPFGGVAESTSYSLHANLFFDGKTQLLSISLYPTTWTLSSVTAGSSKITNPNEKIVVLNNGNVKESYSLQVQDVAGTWSAADTVDGNDVDRYVMSGIFTSIDISVVDNSNFNELGSEDLILKSAPQLSTDTKFATTSSAENGIGVMPNEERLLWLKFNAPKADTTQQGHVIWVIINAELSE